MVIVSDTWFQAIQYPGDQRLLFIIILIRGMKVGQKDLYILLKPALY